MSSRKEQQKEIKEVAARPEYPSNLNPIFVIAFAFVLLGLSLSIGFAWPDEIAARLFNSFHLRPDLAGFLFLVCIYVCGVLIMAPLSPFALAAGLLFGFWWGSLLALVALNMGAIVAFFLARYLLRERLSRKFSGSAVAVLANALRGDAVATITVLRLNPLVPFNLQNYFCGAMGVDFKRYALGTFLGAAPFTIALVYLGYAGRQLVATTGIRIEEWTLLLFMLGLGLALLMTLPVLGKTLKRLRECRDNDEVRTTTKRT